MDNIFLYFSKWASKGLIVVLATFSLSSQANNLFINDGFETGDYTGWTSSGQSVSSSQSHSGSYSSNGLGSNFIYQTFAPISVSDISELSFWGKRLQGGLYDLIEFTYSDSSVSNYLVDTLAGGSVDWSYVNVTSQLSPGKSLSKFLIYGTTAGPTYLDDFKLATTAVPEPETYAMFLAGLGLMGLVARRRKENQV